jgi:putative transposase
MARFARVMLEGWPFHLTHRGNHRNQVFRSDDDRRVYLHFLDRFAKDFGMSIWAYCLMGNHVHLIAVGESHDSISKALGNTHRTCSRLRNLETGVTGHLWANRFYSSALDEAHLWAAVRYVELNPVRAGLAAEATDYPWSSARTHAGLATNSLLDPKRPFPGPIGEWADWLGTGLEEQTADRLRANTSTGRPTGSEGHVKDLEIRLGRRLRPRKRGRKKRGTC